MNVIVLSHLRWNFVFQRPQHLLTRWANISRVFYFEEPVFGNYESNFLKIIINNEYSNIAILTAHIREKSPQNEINEYLEECIQKVIKWNHIGEYLLWYLTPMALPFTGHLQPNIVVYDCMDELSSFKGAHPDMLNNELALLALADVVFTGGHHLYEFKKEKHRNIYPFPSSIDKKHFESGIGSPDPTDQSMIPHPRMGFFGVIDERLNIELLDGLALAHSNIHFIMIGPIVKIDPTTLPRHHNIHYLGQKNYQDLPKYLANWDIAFMPFAKNDSTRFISPTKTPEYLSAGIPVISTSIHDVVFPFGKMGFVNIADTIQEFSYAIPHAMLQKEDTRWQKKVKEFLHSNSWDRTWENMRIIILNTLHKKELLMSEFSITEIPK